jgi:hypothetical protein
MRTDLARARSLPRGAAILFCSSIVAACSAAGGMPETGGGAGTTGTAGAGGAAGSPNAGDAGRGTAGGGAGVGAPGGASGSAGVGGSAGGGAGSGDGGSGASGAAGGAGSSVAGRGGQAGAGAGGGAGGTSAAGQGGAGAAGTGAACPASDPLKTKNTKTDAYDCPVLELSAKWGMPDPMIVKAQIQQESSFNVFSVSGDSPCGTMTGWTDAESKSFGLIQTTPACGEAESARLPNGHPNLTKDMTSPLWATSVFNPTINLDEGIKTDVDGLDALKKKFPGCTAIQYNMMAAGAFNSGTGAVTGCGGYNARAQAYVTAITAHYHQFAAAAGWPDPY